MYESSIDVNSGLGEKTKEQVVVLVLMPTLEEYLPVLA